MRTARTLGLPQSDMQPSFSPQNVPPFSFGQVPEEIPPLFHYTDAGGLLGMIGGKKLWLTNIHYQNDSKEYSYAFDMLRKVINKYESHLSHINLDSISKIMGPVFTFSLSEVRDSLSQWRGYCPDGGYAISFTNAQLNELLKEDNLFLGRCIYEEEEQERIIMRDVIGFTPEELFQAIKNHRPGVRRPASMDFSILSTLISNRIFRIAPFLKHKSFRDEKEWRLVKSIISANATPFQLLSDVMVLAHPKAVKIRSRKNLLIPYTEVKLNKDDALVGLQEIVVGPTPHSYFALEACKVLLRTEGYQPSVISVSNSEIPYVNW